MPFRTGSNSKRNAPSCFRDHRLAFKQLQTYSCQCEVCREREYQTDLDTLHGHPTGLQKSKIYVAIALHNLWIEYNLLAETNQAYQKGQLHTLLDELPHRYPDLRWPNSSKKNSRKIITIITRSYKPDDFDLGQKEWNPAPKPIALFLPCSQIKPYTASRSYRTVALALNRIFPEWQTHVQVIFLSGLYGPVPIDMVDDPTIIGYDFRLHSKDQIGISRGVELVSVFLHRYHSTCNVFIGSVSRLFQ